MSTFPQGSMPMPRALLVKVFVAATQPSPAASSFPEHAVPCPAALVMIPEVGLIMWITLSTSSPIKTLPNASTTTPPRPAAPKMALVARQLSPYASADLTPAGSPGHCVPEALDIGDKPPMVVMV